MKNPEESIESFNQFASTLRQWVEQNGLEPQVEFFQTQLSKGFPNVPPKLRDLWTAYLKEILPSQMIGVLCYSFNSSNNSIPSLADQLSNLPAYTPEQRIKAILEKSALRFISVKDLNSLVDLIFEFHRQINGWVTGEFHLALKQSIRNGFQQIKNTLPFSDHWQCARFLNDCGYPIICSEASYQGWLKFSGKKEATDGFWDWNDLLERTCASKADIVNEDVFLHCLFGLIDKLDLPVLCQSSESCNLCPLTSRCIFFSTNFDTNVFDTLENTIRSEKCDELETDDLIKYVLRHHWESSDLQKELLNRYPNNSVNDLVHTGASNHDESFTVALLAIQELLNRERPSSIMKPGSSFSGSCDIFEHYHPELSRQTQESFHILILDNKHRTLKFRMITTGTLNQSLVHPREVFAPAIQLRAAAMVLIHNHPSGDPQPSPQDFQITKRLVEVGDLVGIKVLDHVIIGKNDYYSFIDEGVMP